MDTVVNGLVALALAVFAATQWFISHQAAKRWRQEDVLAAKAQEAAKAEADARVRDVELTHWGWAAIEIMSELDAISDPILGVFDPNRAAVLAHQLSAMVDKGRLFFPNVTEGVASPKGYRVKLLDEVLRAHYVAAWVAKHGIDELGQQMSEHVNSVRKRFTLMLQDEMKASLKAVGRRSAGDNIPKDPTVW